MPYSLIRPAGTCLRSIGAAISPAGRPAQRRFLLPALVWPVVVVVLGVPGQDLAEVPLAEDQHVIQALAAKCSYEPPGE